MLPPLGADGEQESVPGVAVADFSPRLLLRGTWFDTQDLRLTRSDVVLRHQSGGGTTHWHLRLPGGEVTEPGGLAAVPPRLLDLLTPWLRDGELAAVAAVRTERTVTVLRGSRGEPLAELVDDGVAVLEGRRVALKHRELTLRGAEQPAPDTYDDSGAPDVAVVLAEAARRLAGAGAVEGERVPALARALGPRGSDPPDVPLPVRLRPCSPAGAVVAHSLRTGVARLLTADTAVRLDRADGIHQMRVACRRLRSDLGTFAALVEQEWAAPLRDGTRWLAGELGAARDLEVLRERFAASAAADSLSPLEPAHLLRLDSLLAARAARAEARVLAALRGEAYRTLLGTLVAAARAPATTPAGDDQAEQVLPALVGSAWARLARRAGRLREGDPDGVWHEARIRAKRARYAAEAVTPALGKKAAATGRAAATVQEVLGEHQDAATAAEVLAALALEHPDDSGLCLTLGRLLERQRAAVIAARRSFPAVWREADSAKASRWTRPAGS